MSRLPVLLASVCCAAALTCVASPDISPDVGEVPFAPPPHSGLTDDWVRGPFIEIYVRGFKDSNGDGHGDLQGVIEKLDYLQAMGFRGIWLMPIFDSSDANHGYAIKNYRAIESRYGTEADLLRLIAEMHKRNMGLLLDYVPNQASAQHPLFQDSIRRDSPWRNYFVWAEGAKPEGWSGYTGESWHELSGAWYYGVYDIAMPDWNWHNPDVLEFHLRNMRYWLNRGVDGFRQDAVGPLVENGRLAWVNQPESLAMMGHFSRQLRRYPGARYQVCEAPSEAAGYAAEDACGSAFAFGLQTAILRSATLGRVDRDLIAYLRQQPVARMGTFLSNHDTFPGPRVYQQVGGDLADYRLAAATQYLLPGVPFTLYGEEIGMSMSSNAGGSDEQIRAPLPWSGEQTEVKDSNGETHIDVAGFTRLPEGRTNRLFRPLPDNWRQFNVASQLNTPGSLLHFYRELIALRRAHDALSIGDYQHLQAQRLSDGEDSAHVFTFIRQHGRQRLLVAINYANQAQNVRLPLKKARLQRLWQSAEVSTGRTRQQANTLQMPAKSVAVWRVQ